MYLLSDDEISFIVCMIYDTMNEISSSDRRYIVQGVQLKSGPYFNTGNLFTKIYNMREWTQYDYQEL